MTTMALLRERAARSLAARSLRRFIAAAGVAALCTCGTLDKVDVDASALAKIPKATILDELLAAVDFGGFDDIDFSKEIANQGVKEDQIDSVRMKTFNIHTEGSNATLDFIESAEFYAVADGLPEVLVADSADFKGKTSVDLKVHDDVELKPYVTAPSMTLEAKVKGKRPDQDTSVTADVTLTVDATVPGCE